MSGTGKSREEERSEYRPRERHWSDLVSFKRFIRPRKVRGHKNEDKKGNGFYGRLEKRIRQR